ncbi:hypothetical protein BH11PSE11_BH11PSE11_26470 [soil metagenome]
MSKPGRNDPCPCGSGKKYKQCCAAHGENPPAGSSPTALDAARAVQAGLECHQAGRLGEAERYYRHALSGDPANVDALHFLGVLAHQIRRHAQGAELIEQSIRLDASNAVAHNNLGDAYRALGRFDDAMASFHKALALQPDFHEVRNNLGETLRTMGRFAEAAVCYRQVLIPLPNYAVAHNNLGLALQGEGDLIAALECFDSALGIDPGYANAHNNRGECLRKLDRNEEAKKAYQQALALKPEFAEAHNNLGLLLREQGQVAEAQAAFDNALALRPDFAEVHNNLGLLLQDQARSREALARFKHAIALKPAYMDAHCNLASAYRDLGLAKEALLCCQAALDTDPAEPRLWSLFADTLRLLPLNALDAVDPTRVLAALKMDQLDAQKLERIAVALVMRFANQTQVSKAVAQAIRDEARPRKFWEDEAVKSFIGTPLLLAVLEETIVTDAQLETLLTAIRQALLQSTVRSHADDFDQITTRFGASLAQQCFANEYVFYVSAEEASWQAQLLEMLAADVREGKALNLPHLMLAASYQPMHGLPFAADIKLDHAWPEWTRQVILRQLVEPVMEARLKDLIPQLTPVDNAVSQAVQLQYEESPYPRWRKSGSTIGRQHLRAYLQHLFPQQALQPLPASSSAGAVPGNLEVLVAGCGTGYHAIQSARRFQSAQVLAVDLSSSSLAYARRSSEALGITNVEYGQADILKLASLDRQFDVVESCGVLHHMAEPMRGWKVLVDLLRPGGAMLIGLYSERARRQVTALRELIAQRDYPATPDGIRRFRSDAVSGRLDVAIGDLAASPDFNSTSACRDLLFHVQEHVFTPLGIRDCLASLGLKFLGFEIAYPEVKRDYLASFPENPACDSLENWDAFEQDRPHVFAGMYQFWVQKMPNRP